MYSICFVCLQMWTQNAFVRTDGFQQNFSSAIDCKNEQQSTKKLLINIIMSRCVGFTKLSTNMWLYIKYNTRVQEHSNEIP